MNEMNSKSRISGPSNSALIADQSRVIALSSLDPGSGGKVVRIDKNLKSQIAAMGVRAGCQIELDSKQPLKGPLVVKVGNVVTSIGRKLALGIEVEVDE